MQNFIEHIHIKNFKSIKHCEIEKCGRINLFIGRPNVGKSNILEALSLFSIPYLRENTTKKLSGLIRLENESELFYNGQTDYESSITTNLASCTLRYNSKEGLSAVLNYYLETIFEVTIDASLFVRGLSKPRFFEPNIKKYSFKQNVAYKKGHAKYLIPPFGFNLLSVIEQYKQLKKEVIGFFNDYGLEIAFDKGSQTIKIIQKGKDGIFLIPYNSVADTLQRIIFYKAAIASNSNAVLLFEEPEAHSFPPYMTHLTQEMLYKNDNQYFIATHSPFILNDLLENGRDQLAVFIVYYEHSETKLRQLSSIELHEILQDGIDIFTNSESFV